MVKRRIGDAYEPIFSKHTQPAQILEAIMQELEASDVLSSCVSRFYHETKPHPVLYTSKRL